MGEDGESHNKVLREVLSRLSEENFIVTLNKCTFPAETISFLDIVLGKEQVEINKKKIEAITDWPLPSNRTNYLRKFMPDYTNIYSTLPAASHKKEKGAPLTMTGA